MVLAKGNQTLKPMLKFVGNKFIANTGGAIHGHPLGTKAGALAMRQVIDKKHGKEYEQAITKWGLITVKD
tara:strand:+ start:1031 stop:1240 length:210 start_codon:yes stop_codon:yes gene_type:complete